MTHDELLAKINPDWDEYVDNSRFRDALRAVVELHKPFPDNYNWCSECSDPHNAIIFYYPCSTIETIIKELQ